MRLDFRTKMLVKYKEVTIDGSDQLDFSHAIEQGLNFHYSWVANY